MNWFQQNRFLGAFLVALGFVSILSLFFLLREKGAADAAQSRLESTINELTRLQFLSSDMANELCRDINAVEGERVLARWDARTGFLVRLHVVAGGVAQWWINGPLDRDTAKLQLEIKPDNGRLH